MRAAPSEADAAADTRVFGYQACMSSNVAPGGSRNRLPSKKGGSPRGYRTHVRVQLWFLCTPIRSRAEGLPACRRDVRVTFTHQTDGYVSGLASTPRVTDAATWSSHVCLPS